MTDGFRLLGFRLLRKRKSGHEGVDDFRLLTVLGRKGLRRQWLGTFFLSSRPVFLSLAFPTEFEMNRRFLRSASAFDP